MNTEMPNAEQQRVLDAGLIIAAAAADPNGDRPAARQRAIDMLTDDDMFMFAMYLAVCAGRCFAAAIDTPNSGITTIEVTDTDGNPVPIDDVAEPTRTAWRCVLAGANGDSPAEFLAAVNDEDDASELTAVLVQLYEAAVTVATRQEHTS